MENAKLRVQRSNTIAHLVSTLRSLSNFQLTPILARSAPSPFATSRISIACVTPPYSALLPAP
ncbi:hypothetical protein FIBSPDRAFT_872609 [Athelia psychrophila]|uniref:Uncharacterized protein n=1 Tax=Athelia psychrophila TaxID=1759441 RepID=A0A165ZB19_9AGAM|nr:hypothetical protein FIBSPDRAFT_872609 [Fibularhizoctonia sp. CBS 109695]